MMKSAPRYAWQVFLLSILFLSAVVFGQDNSGIPTFASLSSGIYDTVKISTGTVLLNLPVRTKSRFAYSLASNVAVTMYAGQVLMNPSWTVSVLGGPSPATDVARNSVES